MEKWNQMIMNFLEMINDKQRNANKDTSTSHEVDDPSVPNDEIWDPPEAENNIRTMLEGDVRNNDNDEVPNAGISEQWALSQWKENREVKEGKLKDLVSQLLRKLDAENSCVKAENWVDIVTSLAWEAALFMKHGADEGNVGKAMDPFRYLKIKCIASGSRAESRLCKGLVFKKRAAHKHMIIKNKNPRLLLLKGNLGPFLGSSGLTSFNSMFKYYHRNGDNWQDELVRNLRACQPNVILLEKSASRDVMEIILQMGLTLVLDMKYDRLERVARCTGSPIFSSDTTFGPKLRHCESLYFKKFMEEHAIVGEGEKKLSKTLMFLEGCPDTSDCTILLKGSHAEELKKIKGVVECAVILAYHFLMETSFLVEQKAMFSAIAIENAADISSTNEHSTSVVSEDSSTVSDTSADGAQILTSSGGDQDSSDAPEPTDESHSVSSSSAVDGEAKGLADGDEESISISAMDEISTVLASETILVWNSIRNVSKGTICKRSYVTCIKFYWEFDAPLRKFLQDNLFNQALKCEACRELPEAHCYNYANHSHNKQLTIRVKRLAGKRHLPGESEGHLWMWSRCSKCEPSAKGSGTKRVLVSKATRCLSFGKFLELNFSSHSTYNRLSICGHSIQEDFHYFFGYGAMVAMFQ